MTRWILRRPRTVLALWLIGAVAAVAVAGFGVTGAGLFDRLESSIPRAPGEAATGLDILERTSDGTDLVGLVIRDVDVTDPGTTEAVTSLVEQARTDLAALPTVQSVADPFALPPGDPRAAPLIAAGADGFTVAVTTVPDAGLEASEEIRDRLVLLGEEVAAQVPGADAAVGGSLLAFEEITEQVERDLRRGELVALPLSLLVMIVVFGGLLAAGTPIIGALASIAGALACLYAFSFPLDLDSSVVSVVSVLGLGLSIDYGLLIVSRYREELRKAGPPLTGDGERARLNAALTRTMATAGRTVTYSGVIVALSLSGLLVFEATILRAIGAAGLSVVAVALLVALTLVPALLRVLGSRLDRPGALVRLPVVGGLARVLGDVPAEEGAFSRIARAVQRRPIAVTVAVTAVLALLALPVGRMDVRTSGIQYLPVDNEQRVYFDTLDADYPALRDPEITVVAATTDRAAVDAWATGLTELPGVTAVDPARVLDGEFSAAGVRLDVDDAVGSQAREAVGAVRDAAEAAGFETFVTGQAANLVDLRSSIAADAPLAAGLVALATLVLLFLMTGSVLIPIKALILNVVSLGATLGILVVVFQDGVGESLLAFTSTGGVEIVVVPLVLAFGFGLAMDYEVFLLARIKEFHVAGHSTDEAVRMGLQRSGRVITAAALIIAIVFSGFVVGELLVVKQTGVALAVAVALDATLVRILLVPATMTWLDEWNWWAPGPLRRLHERLGLRE